MKSNKTRREVDFIGGHGALTPAEEKAISAFIKKRKQTSKKSKKTPRPKAA